MSSSKMGSDMLVVATIYQRRLENEALAASNYPDFGPATVLHGIDPPPAGYSGVERRVDLVDRVLPSLAVALAGYKERKHEYCLQVLHIVSPHSLALKAL